MSLNTIKILLKTLKKPGKSVSLYQTQNDFNIQIQPCEKQLQRNRIYKNWLIVKCMWREYNKKV